MPVSAWWAHCPGAGPWASPTLPSSATASGLGTRQALAAAPVRPEDSLRPCSCVLGGRLAASQVASPAELGWGSWRRNAG